MVYIPTFGSKNTIELLYLNKIPLRTVAPSPLRQMGLRLHDALIERLWQGNVQQLQPPTWRCRGAGVTASQLSSEIAMRPI